LMKCGMVSMGYLFRGGDSGEPGDGHAEGD
jgi:hypothetical protein